MKDKMKKLVLLGVWDELPLVVWPWFSDNSREHFYGLSGVRMRSFTFREKGPHPQYLLEEDTEKLRRHFESLTEDGKMGFVKKVCGNYFSQAKKVESYIKDIKKSGDFSKASTKEVIAAARELSHRLSFITIQAWFILLLDIWYPRLEERIELKRLGAKARNHSGHLHHDAKKVLERIILQLSKRSKIKKNGLYYLFPEELKALLGNKKEYKYILEKISQRKKLFVTTNVPGTYSIFEGKKARLLMKEYMPAQEEQVKPTDALKGMPASPGKARGKVRVILLHSQFKDFKKGEVLVALQTMVNFVPLMKKSSAIITEFGGMTSHAAVVSRELRVPCIVSVKGVTKILKNGDLVEVDADKGVIRNIKA